MPASHLLLALAVVAVWGTNIVVIKLGLAELPPFLFATLRFALSALPFLLFIRRPAVALHRLALFGVLLGAGEFRLLFYAMREDISPALASLVIQTQVFFTIALSALAHRERLLSGSRHNSESDFGSRNPAELEADEFAADLLMPMELYRKQLDSFRCGFCTLGDLAKLADRLGTSLTSTARRYCESDREPCTIFFSTSGLMHWGKASTDMQSLGMYFCNTNQPAPVGSKTAELWAQLQAGTAIGKAASEHLATLDYPVFTSCLHLYVAYREAAATGQSVLEYDRQSKAAAEFTAFFTEVLEVTPHA